MKNLKSIFVLSLLAFSFNSCVGGPENTKPASVLATPINTKAGMVQIIETDNIDVPGNDIESVSINVQDGKLVIAQKHKAVKGEWHRIRVYLTVNDNDTTPTPMPEGAPTLAGLVAEYGYSFEYTGNGWNTNKQNVSNGTWVDESSVAKAIGGNTALTTIVIPLNEIGNPLDNATIKMMFVGTGNGWGVDQAPNNGMYEYVIEAL